MILLELSVLKTIFLYLIFLISGLYQIILIITMIRKRHTIDFLSAIRREGNLSKAGIFFFILMLVIVYQALFLDDITSGLVELMGLIIAGDVGANYINNKKYVDLEKIKKTKQELSCEEFKNL